MSIRNNLIVGTAAFAVASVASADFIGFTGVANEVGDYTVIKMYAVYDQADIALNVFGADITTTDAQGFHHSDVQAGAGGTWAPTASLDIPGFADSNIDSFANMGYGVGPDAAFNSTSLDPTFIDATGGLGPYVPAGAGWFNGNPTNEQGVSAFGGGIDGISGFAIMIGQFVWSGDQIFSFSAEMGANSGAGTDVVFGEDTFVIPAPGALALLGLGGLVARRRRG